MKRGFPAILAALALLLCALAPPAAAAQPAIDTKAYAAEVLRLVNVARAEAGLAALQSGPAPLEAAADMRAQEIAALFSHTRPNGSACFTALAQQGVGCLSCGENIASGQSSPAQVMSGWMSSPGHRANILGNFNRLGVGVYVQNGRLHWAQLFILERAGSGSPLVTTTRAVTTTRSPITTRTPTTTGGTANAPGAPLAPGKTAVVMPAWLAWVLRVFFFGWLWM